MRYPSSLVERNDADYYKAAGLGLSPDKQMPPEQLIPGVDYYVENGLWVFTAHYLRRRGHCCRSGCRHCPYGFNGRKGEGDDGKADGTDDYSTR